MRSSIFVFAAFLITSVLSRANSLPNVDFDDMMSELLINIDDRYAREMSDCKPENGIKLTREYDKIRRQFVLLKEYDPFSDKSLNTLLQDIEMFLKSPAASLLPSDERTRTKEFASWIRNALQMPKRRRRTESHSFSLDMNNRMPLDLTDGQKWKSYVPKSLKRGDIVMRRDRGLWSDSFVAVSTKEKRFSHLGIVVEMGEGDDPVLIHSGGEELKGVRSVCKISLATFLSGSVDCAVYRLSEPHGIGDAIAVMAEKRLGIPFDPAFDLKTKDRLYCTEMVRDCVNEAAGREVIGTSRKGDFEYVAVDDCYRNEMTKVWDCRDVKPVEVAPVKEEIAAKPQPRLLTAERTSTTNAPTRRIIRFVPKDRGRR